MKKAAKKKSFDEDIYRRVGINNLILFGIYSIGELGEKCTPERLIKECFTLFPKSFHLISFTEWPDSRKVDRPLRTLRERKFITGNPKTSFQLTKLGKKTTEEIAKAFGQRRLGI